MLRRFLARVLTEAEVAAVDLNQADRCRAHHQVLQKKPGFQSVMRQFQRMVQEWDQILARAQGARIELGAGLTALRRTWPAVFASDVVFDRSLDVVFDAHRMPLRSGAIRLLVAQNLFHHLSDPKRFFTEVARVLATGGLLLMVEPYYGPLASVLYPRLFATEGFDKNAASWESAAAGPMEGANQALSYIVLIRDRAVFEVLFPTLKVVRIEPCTNFLQYLLSGGLNFRQLVPPFLWPLVQATERLLTPMAGWLALHYAIAIRKEG